MIPASTIEAVFAAVTRAFGFADWREWAKVAGRVALAEYKREAAARACAAKILAEHGFDRLDISLSCLWNYGVLKNWLREYRTRTSHYRSESSHAESLLKQSLTLNQPREAA